MADIDNTYENIEKSQAAPSTVSSPDLWVGQIDSFPINTADQHLRELTIEETARPSESSAAKNNGNTLKDFAGMASSEVVPPIRTTGLDALPPTQAERAAAPGVAPPPEALQQKGREHKDAAPETPEQKESRERAEAQLPDAMKALRDGDMKKLCDIAKKLKDDDDALGKLQKMLSQKTGMKVSLGVNGSGVELSTSDADPNAKDQVVTTTSVKFDSTGKATSATETKSGGFGGGADKQRDLNIADTEKMFRDKLAKALNNRT